MVKFSDGRNLVARPLGIDPDTDIALIKVDGRTFLWRRWGIPICCAWASGSAPSAIRWPTSTRSRSAWSAISGASCSTAASTITSRPMPRSTSATAAGRSSTAAAKWWASTRPSASVPATSASRCRSTRRSAILPQLKSEGHVSRGYMGVTLTDVDPDLQASLRLGAQHGALVQDVAAGSPGERAGLRVYDLITAIDGKRVATNDEIIREVARRGPGTVTQLHDHARRPRAGAHRPAGRTSQPGGGRAPGTAPGTPISRHQAGCRWA